MIDAVLRVVLAGVAVYVLLAALGQEWAPRRWVLLSIAGSLGTVASPWWLVDVLLGLMQPAVGVLIVATVWAHAGYLDSVVRLRRERRHNP